MKVLQNEKNITKWSESLGAFWQITRSNEVCKKVQVQVVLESKTYRSSDELIYGCRRSDGTDECFHDEEEARPHRIQIATVGFWPPRFLQNEKNKTKWSKSLGVLWQIIRSNEACREKRVQSVMEFETYKSGDGLLCGCRLSDGAKTPMVHRRMQRLRWTPMSASAIRKRPDHAGFGSQQ
jgi:hypothetical protein